MRNIILFFFFTSSLIVCQNNTNLNNFAADFSQWRNITQPITPDDIPRVERPEGWSADWSANSLIEMREKYNSYKNTLQSIPQDKFTKADSIDFLLLRSAVERVNWELNVLQLPYTHPEFYIQQTVGSLFDLLVISSPFDKTRADNFLIRLQSIPQIINDAKINLSNPISPFARIAISQLDGISESLSNAYKSLSASYPGLFDDRFQTGINNAAAALENYSDWLKEKLPDMDSKFTVGRDNFNYFLKYIAMVPYSPEELLRMGKQEWERAVTFETLEIKKNRNLPKSKIFNSIEEQINQAAVDEQAIREFLEENDIMTIPNDMKHYTLKRTPDYITALNSFGEMDDFTSPNRLNENSVRYIPEPSDKLPYFYKTVAIDPRPLIIHEGLPGHYFQLVQSWQNPDFTRRHYFDSNGNEGIGFYLEEMMLQLGLFDNMPRSREIIYSFMRLRALRVDIDINLALGNYSIEDAAAYLAKTVPMDFESALEGASFYALTPGQAITYQIGKIQILKLISDSKIKFGEQFNLRNFHDYIMRNGNLPVSLMRFEYLDKDDEIKKIW